MLGFSFITQNTLHGRIDKHFPWISFTTSCSFTSQSLQHSLEALQIGTILLFNCFVNPRNECPLLSPMGKASELQPPLSNVFKQLPVRVCSSETEDLNVCGVGIILGSVLGRWTDQAVTLCNDTKINASTQRERLCLTTSSYLYGQLNCYVQLYMNRLHTFCCISHFFNHIMNRCKNLQECTCMCVLFVSLLLGHEMRQSAFNLSLCQDLVSCFSDGQCVLKLSRPESILQRRSNTGTVGGCGLLAAEHTTV